MATTIRADRPRAPLSESEDRERRRLERKWLNGRASVAELRRYLILDARLDRPTMQDGPVRVLFPTR